MKTAEELAAEFVTKTLYRLSLGTAFNHRAALAGFISDIQKEAAREGFEKGVEATKEKLIGHAVAMKRWSYAWTYADEIRQIRVPTPPHPESSNDNK